MRFSQLPYEFAELKGLVDFISQRGKEEYSSSCPYCGGSTHEDGSFPDRFRMFLKSKTTGKPMGWCRSCGYTWWPNKINGSRWQPTEEEKAAWIAERHEREERRAQEIEEARKLLNQERLAEKYHDLLNDEAIGLYSKRGIRGDYWLDFWKLGYCPSKFARSGEINFTTPSLTIPVIDPQNNDHILSIEHRLIHPIDPGDKYRPEMKGLPSVLFVADYERKLSGKTLLVEGKFKAIVTFIFADDPNLHVVGLPGKCPDTELLEQLKECDPLVFCLDPDGFVNNDKDMRKKNGKTAVQRLNEALGSRARVMDLPDKIDDLFVTGALGKDSFHRLMDTARKM